jgi:hypothetical protein
MLVRLIYASRTAQPITADLVDALLNISREHNAGSGITGILCYSDSVFVQALEGSRQAVNQLYAKIVADARHTEVTLLDYVEIAARHYQAWNMAKVKLDKVNLSLLLKYSDKPQLDPFAVTGKATAALLEELATTAVCTSRG